MARHARQIFTAAADLARIECLIRQLPTGARVEVALRDGTLVDGAVVEQPTLQVFENAAGQQGMNALLRIEDRDDSRYLWVGDVARVVAVSMH